MFSDVIRSALNEVVVGQSRAINGVIPGVTRVLSGATPREHSWCAFILLGPVGTGKSSLIRGLAQTLHGDERRVAIADCAQCVGPDPWAPLVLQLAPLFRAPSPAGDPGLLSAPPGSIIQIQRMERAPKEVSRMLASAFDTGTLPLPMNQRASLRNTMIFMTSSLCAREILDEPTHIGFAGSLEAEEEEAEHDRIHEICLKRVEEQFGEELAGRIDGLIVFHRLEEMHLEGVLERRVARLNQWLSGRGVRYEMRPAAAKFLLSRGKSDLRLGARDLVRAHRRYVEFPIADLLVSDRLHPGGVVVVDRQGDEDHLHFTVNPDQMPPQYQAPREVPVVWEEEPAH